MNISIAHYIVQGTTGRFKLHVHEHVNLGNFYISDNNGYRYTFADRVVLAGDKVILHIGEGTDFSIAQETDDDVQETIYVFYWGLLFSEWNRKNTTVSLSEGEDTDIYTLEELLYIPPMIS